MIEPPLADDPEADDRPRLLIRSDADCAAHFSNVLGDHLFRSIYLAQREFVRAYGGIGSTIDEDSLSNDLAQIAGDESARIAYWGCGAREHRPISAHILSHCVFCGARGPLTRNLLSLPDGTALGDPLLLVPLIHSISPSPLAGKQVCVPEPGNRETDSVLLSKSGAKAVIRPAITDSLESVLNLVNDVALSGFVLTGSLPIAIIACAFDVPFCFWDNGPIDAFAWRDFAASIGIRAYFANSVEEGREIFETISRKRLKLPSLYSVLAAAPFFAKTEFLLNAARIDAAHLANGTPLDLSFLRARVDDARLERALADLRRERDMSEQLSASSTEERARARFLDSALRDERQVNQKLAMEIRGARERHQVNVAALVQERERARFQTETLEQEQQHIQRIIEALDHAQRRALEMEKSLDAERKRSAALENAVSDAQNEVTKARETAELAQRRGNELEALLASELQRPRWKKALGLQSSPK